LAIAITGAAAALIAAALRQANERSQTIQNKKDNGREFLEKFYRKPNKADITFFC
jgi:hypothetical protein